MRAIFVAAVCLSASIAFAGEIGDPAPPLQIAEWVKGGPVDLAEGKDKTVYVVEFWATWCPPCKESIPHLSEMAKSFKDKGAVFIGVSDEDAATVKPFVAEMGDRMDYAVAVDDARKTNLAYMKPFHVESIPHAFVVDKTGAIAWHGHPMQNLDQVVQAVLDGKWSAEIAKKAEEAQKVGKEYLELAASGGDPAKLKE
ncbi:MAG: TlpA disulfide reductase family protein, partial [Planctomycetota bacterium]